MGSHQRTIHIVAVPCAAQSHISALMHLCKRLSSEPNIVITFVNVDSIHQQMQKHWRSQDHPGNIRLDQIEFEWKIPNGFDAYCAANNGRFAEAAEQQLSKELSKLIAGVRSNRESDDNTVDCIISDYFCPWTQDVADELSIPRAIFWSGTASWACIEYHVPQLVASKHIFSPDLEESLVDYIGGLAPIPRSSLPRYLWIYEDELWRDHSVRRSQTHSSAAWILVNSFPALETQAFEFLSQEFGEEKVLPVGPLFLLSGNQQKNKVTPDIGDNVVLRSEDDQCLAWLDKQDPNSVLYISFGSIAVLSKREFEDLAEALRSTKVKFLWVVKPELVTGEEDLTGESCKELCSGFGEQGLIISWAPQLRVLAHSSVGGFLTHCGWNSMLESMALGVPMIGWPWAGEQNTNCRLMAEEWKLGAALSGKGGEEICQAIHQVMGNKDSELRKRVEVMRAQCIEAATMADEALVNFIEMLKTV